MRALLPLLLVACGLSTDPLLGGQEGEPLATSVEYYDVVTAPDHPPDPAAPAPPAEPDPGACQVVAHCMGDTWCAEYSHGTVPDLEAECADYWSEGPCPSADAWSTCPLGQDRCTVIWLYTNDDSVCQ